MAWFCRYLGTLLIVTIFTDECTVTQIYFNDQLDIKDEISSLDDEIKAFGSTKYFKKI